jgi:hypothetical protein
MTRTFTPASLLACLLAFSAQAAEIDTEQLAAVVKVLAADEFAGRAPGGPGEEKTIAYLVERFTDLGLQPGGVNGSWTQAVPLVHTRLQHPVTLAWTIGDTRLPLVQGQDVEVSTVRPLQKIGIDAAPVVFVGYGVHAPERQWDDFGDIDLHGKVAIFLVNDPDFAAGPEEAVAGRFGNRRMTYYGRWTYKFEEAARRGAIAALIVHEDKAAGYGWNVASSSPGENYALARAAEDVAPVILQGWLRGDAAAQLFERAGLALEERARWRAVGLRGVRVEGVTHERRPERAGRAHRSRNVLALLPGTSRPDETIMVAAHWDAYGQGGPDARSRTVTPRQRRRAGNGGGPGAGPRAEGGGAAGAQRGVRGVDGRRKRAAGFGGLRQRSGLSAGADRGQPDAGYPANRRPGA